MLRRLALAALLALAPAFAFAGDPIAFIAPTAPPGATGNRIANLDFVAAAVAAGTLPPLASGSIWVGNGSNVATATALPTYQVQAFTSSGTFTTPSNGTTSTKYHIRLVGPGAGGQGGAAGGNIGGSGGAGGYNEFWCTGVAASTGISITIGTGGAGGAAAGGAGGTPSGASSYVCNGTTITANAGAAGTTAGGAGGTSTNGTLNITGQNGGSGGVSAATTPYTAGGGNPLGAGGVFNSSTGNGSAGVGCGGGGSGGFGASGTGGAGANGCAIVDYVL